jgi:hypothetical protein
MSAILHTVFPQSAEELFNIEGQAFSLSVSGPLHRNRRRSSEDSIRNLFVLDPRGQLLLSELVDQPNHGRTIPDRLCVRFRLADGFYQVKTDTNSLAGMSCLKGACFLPESLQVIRATSATGSPGLPIASLIDYASHPVCANYISSFIQMVCRFI